jgi:hypothetical protein
MKGWRPSAWLRLDAGSGSFQADVFLPDIGSIGLSYPPVLGPRACTRGSLEAEVPFFRDEAPRLAGRAETAPTRLTKSPSAIQTAPALHLLKRGEEQETKTRERNRRRLLKHLYRRKRPKRRKCHVTPKVAFIAVDPAQGHTAICHPREREDPEFPPGQASVANSRAHDPGCPRAWA